jgi:poly(hydroxyalkanoate) depolymerase family esterase
MARRSRNPFLSRSFQRTLTAMTRSALRAGTKAVTQAARTKTTATAKTIKTTKKRPVSAAATPKKNQRAGATATNGRAGAAISPSGTRRYRLFKPPGVLRHERLPLLVMLHGCTQDARGLSASSRMNSVATRERFLVLYAEQDRTANAQGCWNWYDTRTGRAEREADSIDAAITQICLTQPVDVDRIAVAGLSAGASMAALLAMRRPERFRAVAMHSGVAPGVAHSTVTAISAMLGRRVKAALPAPLATGVHLPALLVIHGSADHVVAPSNGTEAARLWAEIEGAKPGVARTVQRGARHAMQVTDYRAPGRLVATLCEVSGLGHAWSGGAASQPYSDPKGPDASRLIWVFAAKQFATVRA